MEPPAIYPWCRAGDLVVVSPDVGGVARARAFAKKLSDAPLAIVDKRRSAHNVSKVMNLIGDVDGKVAVLVDDMIDTAGTITNAAKVLHEQGAKAVYACATHAVFSPPAVERLSSGAPRVVCSLTAVACMPPMRLPVRGLVWPRVASCGLSGPSGFGVNKGARVCAGVFNEVIVTNTIPVPDDRCFPQLTVLSVANLLGENIWKIYNQTPGDA